MLVQSIYFLCRWGKRQQEDIQEPLLQPSVKALAVHILPDAKLRIEFLQTLAHLGTLIEGKRVVEQAVLLHKRNQLGFTRKRQLLDVKRDDRRATFAVPHQRERFLQSGDLNADKRLIEPTAGVELLGFLQGQFVDGAIATVGCPHNAVVKQDDHMAVFRRPNVQLEPHSQLHARSEGGKRILGRVPQQSAMSDRNW